jgi:hypothetical protein
VIPVGPPGTWPQALKTTMRIMLTSRHPMFLWWGEALTCFYNDAYSALIGPDRHPSALGQPGRKVWVEIWDVIGPQIDLVMAGQGATWHERQLIPITRVASVADLAQACLPAAECFFGVRRSQAAKCRPKASSLA